MWIPYTGRAGICGVRFLGMGVLLIISISPEFSCIN
jgi:hypothetical protein